MVDRLVAFTVLVFGLSAVLPGARAEEVPAVPGEYVVHWAGASTKSVSKAHAVRSWMRELGPEALLQVRELSDASYSLVRLAPGTDGERFLQAAQADESVLSAEPNYLYRTSAEDPMLSQLWGMTRAGGSRFGLGMDAVWSSGRRGSAELRVGVVDTGIEWEHPDLAENLFTNPGESGDKARNGIDDDGNGYVDDVHGWNFVAKNPDSRDDVGHGTHVAGTIGAVGGNGIGVAGVNWNVTLVPIKGLGPKGGSLDALIEAIDYGIRMDCRVLNNSWGGGGKSKALEAKIQEAGMKGVLFVAAAGNDSRNNDGWFMRSYPSSYPQENILAVAAIDREGKLARFSNYGKTRVDVAAPGVDILSTFLKGGYKSLSGTSMATPHVAGLAALLYAAKPWVTPQEVIRRIVETSVKDDKLSGKVVSNGFVDAEAALSGF